MSLSIFSKNLSKLTALSALLGSLICAIPASAGTFAINPTRLTFLTMTSGDVAITNVGQESVRLSVHAFDWSQDDRNAEILSSTKNVVYYPQIFTLAPGASQRIRIGVLESPSTSERAYRLIVNELPAFVTPGAAGTAGVHFLSRVDIPVLLAPTVRAVTAPELGDLTVHGNTLDLVLANKGTTHIEQSKVSIVARGASGATIWRTTANAFYILADSRITLSTRISPQEFRRAASVSVSWHAPGSTSLSRVYTLR